MQIRDLDAADLDAALDIRTRAFGYVEPSDAAIWKQAMEAVITDGRALAVYDGARLLAMARINQFTQWWHGRQLPMAGIGGVVVAPEERGRGVGRALMLAILERSAALGYPVSALYPATVPLYRSVGWEFGGARHRIAIPTEALRGLGAEPVPLRRVGPADAAEVLATIGAAHTAHRDCGPIDRGEASTRTWLDDERLFCYLADDGFLAYRWDAGQTLLVARAIARSEVTTRALWALVGTGSSVATTIRAYVAPEDPVRWLTRESVARLEAEEPWMLRIVDAPAAVSARGFPAGVSVEVLLSLTDPQRSGNTGTWRLTVASGRGELAPADEGAAALRLEARGFAALYAGAPVATLRRAGLATGGDPAVDPALDAAFACSAFMLDYF
jgi:predicted acetyltransferase